MVIAICHWPHYAEADLLLSPSYPTFRYVEDADEGHVIVQDLCTGEILHETSDGRGFIRSRFVFQETENVAA